MYYFALAIFDTCDEVIIALKRFNTAGTVRGYDNSGGIESVGEMGACSGGKKAFC